MNRTLDRLAFIYKRARHFALTKPDRDPVWLEAVRLLPCARCKAEGPSDPHHVYGSVFNLKSSDLLTVPLCRKCHTEVEGDQALREDAIEGLVSTMTTIQRMK
jgi:hypothetical protein